MANSKIIVKYFKQALSALMSIRLRLLKAYYRLYGIRIGSSTFISPKAYIDRHGPGEVLIGENCYITRNVVILCHTDTKRGGPLGIWKKEGGTREFGDTKIGNNVFIGVNSVIMPGVTIQDNAIIGALTLVDKDVPAGKIVCGNPGKIIGNTKDHVGSIKSP